MDLLVCHLLPSLLFGFYGLLWLFQSFWLHQSTRHDISTRRCHSREALQHKSYIPLFCCPGLPLETLLIKMAPSLAGLIFMAASGYHAVQAGHVSVWSLSTVLVHMTMYGMLLLSGLVDLLTLCIPYPKQTPQAFLTVTFLAIGFTMYFLFEVHSPLEATVQLVFMAVAATIALFSGLRALTPVNVWINTGFSLSLVLLGSWFMQIWFVLHGPHKWDTAVESNKTFAKNCFVWHIVCVVVGAMMLYACLSVVGRRKAKKLNHVVLHSEAERDKLLLKEEIALNEEMVDNNCEQVD